MTKVIHGTISYRFYDEKVLLNSAEYFVNGEAWIEYIVTRDPSSGGDFADWEFSNDRTLFVYNDEGDRVTLNFSEGKVVWEQIKNQLSESDITDECIADALNFD